MTIDYESRARECWSDCLSQPQDQAVAAIAAALKDVAEEAVKEIGRCADCTGHKDPWIRESAYLELKAKLRAFESATPDSPEVKEAVEYFVSREGGHSYLAASVHGLKLVDAYRSALVRIRELENHLKATSSELRGLITHATRGDGLDWRDTRNALCDAEDYLNGR